MARDICDELRFINDKAELLTLLGYQPLVALNYKDIICIDTTGNSVLINEYGEKTEPSSEVRWKVFNKNKIFLYLFTEYKTEIFILNDLVYLKEYKSLNEYHRNLGYIESLI